MNGKQLLRANAGTNGGNTSSTMMFQLKMGASAAAMAARSRNHEVETQKQREHTFTNVKWSC